MRVGEAGLGGGPYPLASGGPSLFAHPEHISSPRMASTL